MKGVFFLLQEPTIEIYVQAEDSPCICGQTDIKERDQRSVFFSKFLNLETSVFIQNRSHKYILVLLSVILFIKIISWIDIDDQQQAIMKNDS